MPELTTFPFAFDPRYRLPARLVGVRPRSTGVHLVDDRLLARFGRWRVETPLTNVTGAGRSGPFSLAKTIGPAHLSFADHGLTFATNADAGVCVTFESPVRGIDPAGWIRHPGLTVTVEDPEALVVALAERGVPRTDREFREEEQAATDDLHTMTASELRALAATRGIAHPTSMRKAELVTLLEDDLGPRLAEELR
jgi:hypothetical protein